MLRRSSKTSSDWDSGSGSEEEESGSVALGVKERRGLGGAWSLGEEEEASGNGLGSWREEGGIVAIEELKKKKKN